jgi:flagellum-specific ATP synthase
VLVEGDDMNDPVADHARSILDGHVVLSRRLAAAGHFPTIDVLHSVSRLTSKICSPEMRADASALRRMLSAYDEARELIEIGAYAVGADPWVDRAIELRDTTTSFLQQPQDEVCDIESSLQALHLIAEQVRR